MRSPHYFINVVVADFNFQSQVSASGDGKMILWDLQNGERVRTFEGHDRGLACIEFKVIMTAIVNLPPLTIDSRTTT